MAGNNLFDSMVREALEEVGKDGWKAASNNAVTLAAFGIMSQSISKKINSIVKPAWVIALSVATAVVWLVISNIFGL